AQHGGFLHLEQSPGTPNLLYQDFSRRPPTRSALPFFLRSRIAYRLVGQDQALPDCGSVTSEHIERWNTATPRGMSTPRGGKGRRAVGIAGGPSVRHFEVKPLEANSVVRYLETVPAPAPDGP